MHYREIEMQGNDTGIFTSPVKNILSRYRYYQWGLFASDLFIEFRSLVGMEANKRMEILREKYTIHREPSWKRVELTASTYARFVYPFEPLGNLFNRESFIFLLQ